MYHIPTAVAEHQNEPEKKRTQIALETARRLQEARDFIDQNACGTLRVRDMATKAFMSEFHFFRLFKEAFGLSPHQYYLQKKIDMARDMVLKTDHSVTEIAYLTGFNDIYSFSRVFKNMTGLSPALFREAHVKGTHKKQGSSGH